MGLSCSSLGAPWVPPGALLGPFGLNWELLGPQGGPGRTPGLIFHRFVCAFLMFCDDCWLIVCLFLVAAGAVDVNQLNVFRAGWSLDIPLYWK